MSLRLKSKTVLLTTAGQGIGLPSVQDFATKVAYVHAVDINQKTSDELSKTHSAVPQRVESFL